MERSIPQVGPPEGPPDLGSGATQTTTDGATSWGWIWPGAGLVALCLVLYLISQPSRGNPYLHFVLQAQSWLDGQTSIPTPGYQDVMPILGEAGQDTGRGIIPFPPLPAWVLLPFVAVWHMATNEQLLAVVFAAVDVGIAYWMLGHLPVRPAIRWLTALFLGLGSVLWYAAAIGSTWFWAHIVAVGCLLLAVGLALSVDRYAAEPRALAEAIPAVRNTGWRGGWRSVALLGALAICGELLFVLAGAGTPVAALAALGVAMSGLAAALAVTMAGRTGVLAAFRRSGTDRGRLDGSSHRRFTVGRGRRSCRCRPGRHPGRIPGRVAVDVQAPWQHGRPDPGRNLGGPVGTRDRPGRGGNFLRPGRNGPPYDPVRVSRSWSSWAAAGRGSGAASWPGPGPRCRS